jgi:hypothetical protein
MFWVHHIFVSGQETQETGMTVDVDRRDGMNLHEISQRTQGQHSGVKLVVVLLLAGVMIEMVALIAGIAIGVSAGDYFSETKVARDTAAAGSGLLSQIGTISAVKSWLTPLQFLGFAMLFTGIAVALATIIKNLQLRAEAFAAALPKLISGSDSSVDGAGA